MEFFKAAGERLSNWGRWGSRDRRGTLNFITPARVAVASRRIRSGRTFSLAHPIGGGAGPRVNAHRTRPVHTMSLLPGDLRLKDGAAFADDAIAMPLQCGTQWDGLAHCSYDGLLYNGESVAGITIDGGAETLGIEHIADGIVGRGVLLDVAALKGTDALPAGTIVTPADLDAAEARQHVRAGPGDILLVRTGWRCASDRDRLRPPNGPPGRQLRLYPEAGLSQSCCDWLSEREIAAIAADNYAVEVIPVEDSRATLPVHCILIRDIGMTIGELFALDDLARDCAADGTWDFFLAAPPLKIPHALGSPINPVAIK
jgi:kynurenine formamidase